MTVALPGLAAPTIVDRDRVAAVHAGVRVEQVAIAWMVIEAVVAIGAGILARSVLLTAFGIDSVIELVAGGVLLWRLLTETRGGTLERVERAENHAAWITGVALVLLCLYVVISAVAALLARTAPDHSYAGIAVALAAVVGMPILARRKRAIAARIDSAALRGDAACSITCAYMACALLIGLLLNAALGWWWADGVAALALLYWLGLEAREALEGARAGRGGCSCGDESCAG
ncbi:MAG TPA: cation transporter [Chloroflexota bacterium]|nr:cation transporter [Chloroflexota bacterium]